MSCGPKLGAHIRALSGVLAGATAWKTTLPPALAERVCDKLDVEAAGGKLVFITAHGWINRMIKGSLKKRGWICVSQNGDLHWSFRRFERISDKES